MTAKTLRALKASIRHWEEMRRDPMHSKHEAVWALCVAFFLDNKRWQKAADSQIKLLKSFLPKTKPKQNYQSK